ncbi:guanine-N(7)-methyltransferase domain-containing protein [Filobasidium floriforme]|uniref:guanine-N(7)-methyltransferase domain-containing protein n=1 Tax=Filobasidium floriforme TaxID=5210 RepID=UPI001E8D9B70|nr:guanine-N(7)-methyltransferase domain-containing protein [Filobasidium floriforme]KAH8082326.1 guanine-N(7)-methyltransferase domain-containing protein [Filobasidium floriforme]
MKLCTENQFAHLSDNARGNTGRAARTQSATYGLKTCNNWIKSVLIARFTRRRPGVSDFDPEDRSLRPNGRVLDMGCGKGGDIDKWNRAKIEEYVGIDVASGSIQDFNERIQSSRRRLNFRPHLYVLDCFSFPISVAVPRALLEPKFDTISMQFCMHYAFESEKKVRQMLENISNSLRIGGTFLGTTLSASRLLDLLSHIPEESEELSIGNPYYNIVFDKRDYEGTYGHSYRFTLVEAVEDCAEFIVHWEAFRELALSYGLKEVYRKDFDEVFAEEQTKPESVKLAERMGVTTNGHLNMDAEQWSACSIYMAFAFMKVK